MKKLFTLIIAAVALIAITIFTLQNSQVITVSIFFWEIEASLSLVLFTTFSLAILISVLAIIPTIYHLKKVKNKSQKEVENLLHEQESIYQEETSETEIK